jgi:hypothetical protein
MPTIHSESNKLDRTISPVHRSERAAIDLYLSDPSISSEVAEAMLQAYKDTCRELKLSGRSFSTRAVATLIDNYAHDGEHNADRLVEAVLAALSRKMSA